MVTSMLILGLHRQVGLPSDITKFISMHRMCMEEQSCLSETLTVNAIFTCQVSVLGSLG